MSRSKLALTALAATLVFGAVPASALTGTVTRSVEVDISARDLSTEEGARMVLTQIRDAAEKACYGRSSPVPPAERHAVDECMATAIDQAVSSLATTRERQANLEAARRG